MKVLSKFAADQNLDLGLKLHLEITSSEDAEISDQKIEEMKSALRELGLSDDVREG